MKIHFIGIGGIGVSALAQYYLAKGYKITGSDLVFSEVVEKLEEKGIKVSLGPHRAENIPKDVDLVVYSPAVQNDNPEYKQAKDQRTRLLSYPEALGEVVKEYFTIAISGTHGKSTTCSMLSLVLIKAGLDPTVIIGTKLKEFGDTNFREGKSKYLIIEADEWKASLLNYYPQIIGLTNIEKEHLDYYRDLEHILKTFKEFFSHLPKNGHLIDARKFNLKNEEAKKLKKILKVPGDHNVSNALLVLNIARVLKISDEIIFKALSEYKGSWRRFDQRKLEIGNWKLEIIHDYAHHPTEIKATLTAAREKFPDKKIWCIFQPHQYQRTYFLFNDFVRVFSSAPVDKLIIVDIYDVAGREKGDIKGKVSSKKLIEKIDRPWAEYLHRDKVKKYLEDTLKGEEVVIIMGAGDVYKLLDTN
ncbi:UDP-N-acetylmuramate--L-alanine ligase, partial [Patescibacteria group bacterium]|nr:UDP-N-acetylmuramate--L-alanine ligase [Patescibacteria group bacterium]